MHEPDEQAALGVAHAGALGRHTTLLAPRICDGLGGEMSRVECRGGRRVRGLTPTSSPLITVVTVVFNAVATFEATLRSVVDQQSPLVEYLVIDGGSTDGTLDLIRRHDADIDYWVSEPDNGIYDAMNKSRAAALGDWLLFLGADDELVAQIDDLVEVMADRSAVYYGNVLLRKRGTTSGGRFSTYRLMNENICHQAVLYPRTVYASKPYDTACGVLADHKYNIELWGEGTRFEHLDRTISRYNETGLSSHGDPTFESQKLAAIRAHFGLSMFLLKRARSLAARLLKPRPGSE